MRPTSSAVSAAVARHVQWTATVNRAIAMAPHAEEAKRLNTVRASAIRTGRLRRSSSRSTHATPPITRSRTR